MAGVGVLVWVFAAVLSVNEMFNGDRKQWKKFLRKNKSKINEVKDQQGRPLLISAIKKLRVKWASMPVNAEFELFCRREIDVIKFFSKHCDVAVKNARGCFAADIVMEKFISKRYNPAIIKLVFKLLTPQLINNAQTKLLFHLILHRWWEVVRLVISDIGITPDVVATVIGVHFPCLVLPKDIAARLAVPNENEKLKAAFPDRYKIADNPKSYNDILNGISEEKDGFVLVNIRPHLAIHSATDVDLVKCGRKICEKIGIFTVAVKCWMLHFCRRIHHLKHILFEKEINNAMSKSLASFFLLKWTVPNYQKITLSCINNTFIFKFYIKGTRKVEFKPDHSGCLRKTLISLKIFIMAGLYDEVEFLKEPNLPDDYSGKDKHLIPVIKDVWKNFLRSKRQCKTLQQLCISVLRESLSPISADKMQEAGIEGIYFDLVSRKDLADKFMKVVGEFYSL